MVEFFDKHYGLPFYGQLIEWKNCRPLTQRTNPLTRAALSKIRCPSY